MGKENNKKKSKLSRNVLLLGIVSFLNDLSSEMIAPVLPLFITALGGGGVALGLVGGLRDSITSILKVVSGYLSDKLGKRKIFVTSGYFISGLFKLLLSFSKTWRQVLVFSGLERVGKGLRTAPRDAIIADSMPQARGRGFGIHRTLDTLGAIWGGIFALILYWFAGLSFTFIILIAAVISFLSLLPLHFVKEKSRAPSKTTFRLSLRGLNRPLKMYLAVAGCFALANFTYMFFILKALVSFLTIMSSKDSKILSILLYILFNFFYAGFAYLFGILSDKIGRRAILIAGYLLFSLVCLGFAFFDGIVAFVVLFALYGVVYAIVDGNQRAYVSDLAPSNLKAIALGTFHTTISILSLPASLVAGLLWRLNPNLTFIYGSILSMSAALLFFAIKRQS